MRFWIDILHPTTGAKLGSGPIYTALYWEHTARISRAGQVRFGLVSNDARADLIAPKRLARCYTATLPSDNASARIADWGVGIIDSIDLSHATDGAATLSVSGDDLLRELVYRRVGKLRLSAVSDALEPTKAIYHRPSDKSNVNLVDGAVTMAAGNYIYVGYPEPFDAWTPTIDSGNNVSVPLKAQFYSDNEEWDGWQSIIISDGTAVGGATLAQTGEVSWTRPGESWQKMRHDDEMLYWIRFYTDSTLTSVEFASNAITGDGPTTTGPADIMAFAPSAWSLDTVGGSDETVKPIKHQFDGETVLAALIRLAELSGEDFRLSSSANRKVTWRPAKPTTGIRAVYGTAATSLMKNDAVCVIQSMRKVNDTYESFFGRVYAIGADGLTLEGVTSALPAGYSLRSNDAGHCLQHDATWDAFGIELWETFNDIADVAMLYEAAYETLEQRRRQYEAYDVTVVKLETAVLPGDTISVEYQRTSGVFAFRVRESFTVLEITTRIDPTGIRVTRMKLGSKANRARYPDSEEEIVGRSL